MSNVSKLLVRELALPLAEIEAAWRGGEMSIEAIGDRFGLTSYRVRALARRAGWGPKTKARPPGRPVAAWPVAARSWTGQAEKRCSRHRHCPHAGRMQPIAEFEQDGQIVKLCRTCREQIAGRIDTRRTSRRGKRRRQAERDYNGGPPRRAFELPPHHYVLDIPAWHKYGPLGAALTDEGFALLRDGQGRPVARKHKDLRPGEVSLVLR